MEEAPAPGASTRKELLDHYDSRLPRTIATDHILGNLPTWHRRDVEITMVESCIIHVSMTYHRIMSRVWPDSGTDLPT